MLKLPKLYKAWGVHKLEAYCDSLGVQARGAKGEHSPPGPSGEFDISNKARIGYSEVNLECFLWGLGEGAGALLFVRLEGLSPEPKKVL